MNVFDLLTSRFTRRGKALSMYRRGMRLAKKHDHLGAIEEYTAAIELEHVPADVKAMALFNRGLVYMAADDYRRSVDDLEAVLVLDGAPQNIRTMARQKLVKRESRRCKSQV